MRKITLLLAVLCSVQAACHNVYNTCVPKDLDVCMAIDSFIARQCAMNSTESAAVRTDIAFYCKLLEEVRVDQFAMVKLAEEILSSPSDTAIPTKPALKISFGDEFIETANIFLQRKHQQKCLYTEILLRTYAKNTDQIRLQGKCISCPDVRLSTH